MTDKNLKGYFEGRTLGLSGVCWGAALGALLMLACGSESEEPGVTGGSGGGQNTASGGSPSGTGGAAATGGNVATGSGGSTEGTGGNEPGTGRRQLGSIVARVSLSQSFSSSLDPFFLWESDVESAGEPSVDCPQTQVGDCSIANCADVVDSPEPGTAVRLHAGKIAFTVDNGMAFEAAPEPPNNAYSALPGVMFGGGEKISFSAEGGTIEAFSGEIKLPLAPMLLTPAFSAGSSKVAEVTVDSSQDLALTWDVRNSSEWIVLLSRGATDEPGFTCNFDASAGAGVIPAEVLQHVGAGAEFTGRGLNVEEIPVKDGFVAVFGQFDLVNAAKNATPVFIVQ